MLPSSHDSFLNPWIPGIVLMPPPGPSVDLARGCGATGALHRRAGTGPLLPARGTRLIAASADPAVLKPESTWFMATNLPRTIFSSARYSMVVVVIA
jgi:hypothetical protein